MGNQTDNNFTGDDQISGLIGSLKRVDAPNDFDFRVKARIAKGRPAERNTSWLPASVRLAIPLVLLITVGGYFALSSYYSPKAIEVPAVAEVKPAVISPVVESQPAQPISAPPEQLIAERGNIKPAETAINSVTRSNERKTASVTPANDRSGSGSYDEAAREVRTRFPRGIDPNAKPPANSAGFNTNVLVPAKDVLTLIGVNASYDGAGWKVSSVTANSLADRSAVKAGDVIEAIDGQLVKANTSFGNGFSGKSLSVRRGGQSVQIDLKH